MKLSALVGEITSSLLYALPPFWAVAADASCRLRRGLSQRSTVAWPCVWALFWVCSVCRTFEVAWALAAVLVCLPAAARPASGSASSLVKVNNCCVRSLYRTKTTKAKNIPEYAL